MITDWTDRLNSVVLPALIEGTTIYTGLGELHPGQGIPNGTGASSDAQDAINKKPIGIPNWQVYLGAKANQPAIRFLQLIHKVRNPVGSATMVYPTRLRDDKLGVPLIVPLGEGLETPSHEHHVARDLMGTIMFKSVRVIALSRIRFFTTTSPWSILESIVMEVYSEVGELIWTNPFMGMTLEEAIATQQRSERFQTKVILPAPQPNQSRVSRHEVEAEINRLIAQGLQEEELKSHLEVTFGLHPVVADRVVLDVLARNSYPPRVLAAVRDCATRFAEFLEGGELVRAVAKATEQEIPVVHRILRGASFQP